jgi:hypothetical protein
LLAEGEEEDLQHHHHQHQREQRLTQLTRERKGYLKMSQTKKKEEKSNNTEGFGNGCCGVDVHAN